MGVKDLSQFVLKHRNTLMLLSLWFLDPKDGSLEDLRDFFTILRGFPRIEHVDLVILCLDEDLIKFSFASQARGMDLPDEPEYVWVTASNTVVMEGTMEVRDGLMMMAESITRA